MHPKQTLRLPTIYAREGGNQGEEMLAVQLTGSSAYCIDEGENLRSIHSYSTNHFNPL